MLCAYSSNDGDGPSYQELSTTQPLNNTLASTWGTTARSTRPKTPTAKSPATVSCRFKLAGLVCASWQECKPNMPRQAVATIALTACLRRCTAMKPLPETNGHVATASTSTHGWLLKNTLSTNSFLQACLLQSLPGHR